MVEWREVGSPLAGGTERDAEGLERRGDAKGGDGREAVGGQGDVGGDFHQGNELPG